MEWRESDVPGLLLSSSSVSQDPRGGFTKLVSGPIGNQRAFNLDEVFWSRSSNGVLRGLHLQVPPYAGRKIVFLTAGRARDFVLDLRVGSPAHGQVHENLLSAASGALLIPAGCAHGFEALTDDVTMVYLQEGMYDPASDTGVLWSSVGIRAHAPKPTVSDRDQRLPSFQEFDSPFTWSP